MAWRGASRHSALLAAPEFPCIALNCGDARRLWRTYRACPECRAPFRAVPFTASKFYMLTYLETMQLRDETGPETKISV